MSELRALSSPLSQSEMGNNQRRHQCRLLPSTGTHTQTNNVKQARGRTEWWVVVMGRGEEGGDKESKRMDTPGEEASPLQTDPQRCPSSFLPPSLQSPWPNGLVVLPSRRSPKAMPHPPLSPTPPPPRPAESWLPEGSAKLHTATAVGVGNLQGAHNRQVASVLSL